MRAKCFIATAIVVSICNAFAAITIDPIARTFTKTGGAATVLTSGSGTWTASTDSDWISIKPRTSGDAGVSCVYVVSKNMSTDTRVGQVVIDGNIHTVTQTGYDATLDTNEVTTGMDGTTGEVTITVDAGISWTIANDVDWISFDVTSGMGTYIVHYTIFPYAGIVTRTASIRIAGQNFVVAQTGKDVELTPSSAYVESDAGIIKVRVTALETTHWNVSADAEWVYVVDGATGYGDSTLIISYAANESFLDRTATLTIGSTSLEIIQDGVYRTLLTATPQSVVAPVVGGVGEINVSATVDGPWHVNSFASWINIVNGSGTGDGIINYVVSPNQTLSSREAEIDICPVAQTPRLDLSAGLIYWYAGDKSNWYTQDGNLWYLGSGYATDDEWNSTRIDFQHLIFKGWVFDGKSKFSLAYSTGANLFLENAKGISVSLNFIIRKDHAINRLASIGSCAVFFDENGVLWVAGNKTIFSIDDYSLEYRIVIVFEQDRLNAWAGPCDGSLGNVLSASCDSILGDHPTFSDFILGYADEPSAGYLDNAEVTDVKVWCRPLTDMEASHPTGNITGNQDEVNVDGVARYSSLNCNTMRGLENVALGHNVNTGPAYNRFGLPCRALACNTNSYYRIDNLRGIFAPGGNSAYYYVSTNFTCSFWARIDDLDGDGCFILRKIHDSVDSPMDLSFSKDGFMYIEDLSAPFQMGEWMMITLVGRGTGRYTTQKESDSTLIWYINGKEVGQKITGRDGFGDFCLAHTAQTSSGKWNYMSSHLYLGHFRGAIDDCLLVGRALEPSEVLAIYESTRANNIKCLVTQDRFTPSVVPANITINALGGNQTCELIVGSGVSWAAGSNCDWLSIPSGISGVGPTKLTINVAANPRAESRVGTITVAGLTLTVRQEPLWSEVANDTPFPPAEDGGYGIITVTTEGNAAWQAVSDASWLTIIDDGDHFGTDSIMWVADPYTDTTRSRTGTIRVADHLIHITQRGYELSVEPRSKTASSTGETGQIYVSADSEADIWDVIAMEPWITITSGATGAGSKTVTYSLDDNTSGATRTGSILIGGIEYVITQTAKVNLKTTAVGHGTIVGGGEYEANDIAQLIAKADSGYVFSSWGGDVFGVTTNLTVTMDRTKAVTATFIPESAAQQIAKDRGAQGEGLYTRDQIHALEMGNLVLDVDSASGTARVGVRFMESSDLSNPDGWTPVGLSQGDIDIGADGTVGLNVEAKGNAKFFKVVVPDGK